MSRFTPGQKDKIEGDIADALLFEDKANTRTAGKIITPYRTKLKSLWDGAGRGRSETLQLPSLKEYTNPDGDKYFKKRVPTQHAAIVNQIAVLRYPRDTPEESYAAAEEEIKKALKEDVEFQHKYFRNIWALTPKADGGGHHLTSWANLNTAFSYAYFYAGIEAENIPDPSPKPAPSQPATRRVSPGDTRSESTAVAAPARLTQVEEEEDPEEDPEEDEEEQEEEEDDNEPIITEDEMIQRRLTLREQLKRKKEVFLMPYLQIRKRGIAQPDHLHAIGNQILARLRDRNIIDNYRDLPSLNSQTEFLEAADEMIVEHMGGEPVLLALHELADEDRAPDLSFNYAQIETLMLSKLAIEELYVEKIKKQMADEARAKRAAALEEKRKEAALKEQQRKQEILSRKLQKRAEQNQNPSVTERQTLANEIESLRRELDSQTAASSIIPSQVPLTFQKQLDIVNLRKQLEAMNAQNESLIDGVDLAETNIMTAGLIQDIVELQRAAVRVAAIEQLAEDAEEEQIDLLLNDYPDLLDQQLDILDQQFLLYDFLTPKKISRQLDESLQSLISNVSRRNLSFESALDTSIQANADDPDTTGIDDQGGYLTAAQSPILTPGQSAPATPFMSPARPVTQIGGRNFTGDFAKPGAPIPRPKTISSRSEASAQSDPTVQTTQEQNTSFDIEQVIQERDALKKEYEELKRKHAMIQELAKQLQERAQSDMSSERLKEMLETLVKDSEHREQYLHQGYQQRIREIRQQMQQMTPRKAVAQLNSIALSPMTPRQSPPRTFNEIATSPMMSISMTPFKGKEKKRVAFRVEERAPKEIGKKVKTVKARMAEMAQLANDSKHDKEKIADLEAQIENLQLLLEAPNVPDTALEEAQATIEFLNGIIATEDPEKEEMAEWIYYARIEFGELQYKIFDLTHTLLSQSAPRPPVGIGDDQINEPIMADEDEDTLQLFIQGTQGAGGQIQALTEIPKPFFGNPTVPEPLRRPEISGNAPGELPGAVDLNPIGQDITDFTQTLRRPQTADSTGQQPADTTSVSSQDMSRAMVPWKPTMSKDIRDEVKARRRVRIQEPADRPAVRRALDYSDNQPVPIADPPSPQRVQQSNREVIRLNLQVRKLEAKLQAAQREAARPQPELGARGTAARVEAELQQLRDQTTGIEQENVRLNLELQRIQFENAAKDETIRANAAREKFKLNRNKVTIDTERAEVARLTVENNRLFADLNNAMRDAELAQRAANLANQQLAALQQQPVQQPAQPQNLIPAPIMSQRAQTGSQQAMPANIAQAAGPFIARTINPNVPAGLGGGGGGGGGGGQFGSQFAVFAPNRPQVRDEREYGNQSRFAREVSRHFESKEIGQRNEKYNFDSWLTFETAMTSLGIAEVDLTPDTSLLELIVSTFYDVTGTQEEVDALIYSGRKAGAWPLKYKPKYTDNNLVTGRSVTFLNKTQGQVVNSDIGTIFLGSQPGSVIRRQGLNYVVSGPRGEKAVFGTARDAQYYSSAKGKRYGPVTESVFGYKPKNLSQAIY